MCFPIFVTIAYYVYTYNIIHIYNKVILFIIFIIYKYVLFKYLEHPKYDKYSKYDQDRFVKDLRIDLYLDFKDFLKLSNNLKKQYILKRFFLFFYKNYYFETLNILGNFYFINFFLKYKIIFKKLTVVEFFWTKPFILKKNDLTNLMSVHINITNFFVFLFVLLLILTTLIGLYFKKHSKQLDHYFYLYKYSYINVFVNCIILFMWYLCYTNEWGKPYIYLYYQHFNITIVTFTPIMHIVSLIWGSFHFKSFCHLLGTLMNSYFEFDIEKSKPYVWFYYYIYNSISGFMLIYTSYIIISAFILFNLQLF